MTYQPKSGQDSRKSTAKATYTFPYKNARDIAMQVRVFQAVPQPLMPWQLEVRAGGLVYGAGTRFEDVTIASAELARHARVVQTRGMGPDSRWNEARVRSCSESAGLAVLEAVRGVERKGERDMKKRIWRLEGESLDGEKVWTVEANGREGRMCVAGGMVARSAMARAGGRLRKLELDCWAMGGASVVDGGGKLVGVVAISGRRAGAAGVAEVRRLVTSGVAGRAARFRGRAAVAVERAAAGLSAGERGIVVTKGSGHGEEGVRKGDVVVGVQGQMLVGGVGEGVVMRDGRAVEEALHDAGDAPVAMDVVRNGTRVRVAAWSDALEGAGAGAEGGQGVVVGGVVCVAATGAVVRALKGRMVRRGSGGDGWGRWTRVQVGRESAEEEGRQMVVIGQVLDDDVNNGYGQEVVGGIVTQVDGHDVRDVRDVATAVRQCRATFVRLQLQCGAMVVLERKRVDAARERLEERHAVPRGGGSASGTAPRRVRASGHCG